MIWTIQNFYLSMMTFLAIWTYCLLLKYKRRMTMSFLMRHALSTSTQFMEGLTLEGSVSSSAKTSLKMSQWEQKMSQLPQTSLKKSILLKFTYASLRSKLSLKWATTLLASPTLSSSMSLEMHQWENSRPRLPSPFTGKALSTTNTRFIT